MKKNYWWRMNISIVSLVLILISYVFGHKIFFSLCDVINYKICLETTSQTIGKPLFIFSIFLFFTSFFLFFISDKVFLKWLRFALSWMLATTVLIMMAPVYSGGYYSDGITKEMVSIWMGSLFVILSLAQFSWEWYRNRKNKA